MRTATLRDRQCLGRAALRGRLLENKNKPRNPEIQKPLSELEHPRGRVSVDVAGCTLSYLISNDGNLYPWPIQTDPRCGEKADPAEVRDYIR